MKSIVRRQILALMALAGWTLLMWVGRIRNVVGDDGLSGWSMQWRLGVAIGFAAVAVLLAGLTVRATKQSDKQDLGVLARPGIVGSLASVLAAFGIAWWLVRGGGILVGDYGMGFKVVHTVLGSVTIGLSILVLWATGLGSGAVGVGERR